SPRCLPSSRAANRTKPVPISPRSSRGWRVSDMPTKIELHMAVADLLELIDERSLVLNPAFTLDDERAVREEVRRARRILLHDETDAFCPCTDCRYGHAASCTCATCQPGIVAK